MAFVKSNPCLKIPPSTQWRRLAQRCSLPPEGAWSDTPPSHWRAAPEMVTPSHLLELGTPPLRLTFLVLSLYLTNLL